VFKDETLIVEEELPDLSTSGLELPIAPAAAPENAGHAHAIRIVDGHLEAATDPRSDGEPVGF
jgi:hypothetical protein